ncbi:DUF4091 domain-containing protein [Prevotellamassilia timonensis]|uniref:DUF4091 domain-containing protein n=1 Tax=Prevotellamassilia timonensis TaxID=1852370 RepID=UPI003A90086B
MNIKQTIIVPLCAVALSLQAQTTGGKGLQVSWASKDVHYAQTERPVMRATSDTLIKAWRGERVGVEAVVYAAQKQGALQVRLTPWRKGGATIAASQGEARFINYVTTDNFQYCGYHPNNLTPYQVADVIDLDVPQTAEEGTTHPVWCTLEVPADADAGVYSTRLEVTDAQTHKVLKRLNLKIEVNARTLPSPAEQKFHVDFWQQPYAVSRYNDVPRWSQAHLDALRPYLKLLARSGQKVVSAILFYEPWGDQSHDKFSAMVRTTRTKNGEWQYDYTVFDQWVKLCEECGISEQINCFSMVPWDMSFRYYDEAQGKDVDLKTTTSSAEYKALWTAFLKSFAAHLKQQGWYDRTCIAMDERGLNNMLDAYRVAQEAVPGIKMALAGTHHKELVDKLYDYCIGFGEHFTDDELAARKARGWKSTTYTCCSNTEPNLFSNSLPAEAAYLPVFCVANKFEGYLHWSWMNWADNPLTDTRFRLFAPGDTYLIYPGPRSSVRYERFIEGVAMAEKVRILREEYAAKGNNAALDALNKQVEAFAPAGIPTGQTAAGMVNALQQLLNP